MAKLSSSASEILREAMSLSVGSFPALGEGTEGGRGRVSFPTALTTLLHAETRMAMRGASAQLQARGEAAASAELDELAERAYTSACGAFLYDVGACLRLVCASHQA